MFMWSWHHRHAFFERNMDLPATLRDTMVIARELRRLTYVGCKCDVELYWCGTKPYLSTSLAVLVARQT